MHDVPLRNFKPRRNQQSCGFISQRGPVKVFGDSVVSGMLEKTNCATMSTLSEDAHQKEKYSQEIMSTTLNKHEMKKNGHMEILTSNGDTRDPFKTSQEHCVSELNVMNQLSPKNHCKSEVLINISETREFQTLKYTDENMHEARRQMKAEHEKQCDQMRLEFEKKLAEECEKLRQEYESKYEKQMRTMRVDLEEKLKLKEEQWALDNEELLAAAVAREKEKEEEIERLQQQVNEMRTVVAEYEMTLLQIEEKNAKEVFRGPQANNYNNGINHSSDRSRIDLLEEERDQALADFANVETSFSHLYQRYEKMKIALNNFKKNEDTLKQRVSELHAKLKKQEERYSMLKKHAEEKIISANEEIVRLQKQSDAEILRLETSLKRYELRVHNLEQAVEQKAKQNQELEAICDDLLSRVNTGQ